MARAQRYHHQEGLAPTFNSTGTDLLQKKLSWRPTELLKQPASVTQYVMPILLGECVTSGFQAHAIRTSDVPSPAHASKFPH